MEPRPSHARPLGVVAGLLGAGLLLPPATNAHCDTLDGPVVNAAKTALEKGDITPVLKWIKPAYEPEVRAVFDKTLIVRTKGPEARELADLHFFETLVRLHRAGEGEPYAGLKPAGTDPGPTVVAGDKALADDSVDALVTIVTEAVAAGIRTRFAHAREARQHADDSVAAGREFVAAYVQFMHHVERIYEDAVAEHAHHGDAAAPAPEHRHDADWRAGGADRAREPAGPKHGQKTPARSEGPDPFHRHLLPLSASRGG